MISWPLDTQVSVMQAWEARQCCSPLYDGSRQGLREMSEEWQEIYGERQIDLLSISAKNFIVFWAMIQCFEHFFMFNS